MIGVDRRRVTVENYVWLVRTRPDAIGCYDFEWITGPNSGYGFTTQTSDREPLGVEFMERAIADFMANINPDTGYLD